MAFSGLIDKLVYEIGCLHDAEHRLIEMQRPMIASASSMELRSLLESHRGQSGEQIERLEYAFELLGRPVIRITSDAVVGLVRDCKEMFAAIGEDLAMLDSTIAGLQLQIEQYEVTAYRIALATANAIERQDVAGLLAATLAQEEEAANRIMEMMPSLMQSALMVEAAGA
jgi:ferritin-like metal-binding protein YciE